MSPSSSSSSSPSSSSLSLWVLWLVLWAPTLVRTLHFPTQSVSNFTEPASTPESYQLSMLGAEQFPRSVGFGFGFADLLKQKLSGNQLEQCPCVVLPGTNKCMVYDARYQAAVMEEAMITFVDSSMDPRIFDQRLGGQQISASTLECRTEECRQCVGMLALRLRQVGLLKGQPQYPFPVLAAHQLRPGGCPRLRMSRSVPRYSPPASPSRSFLDLISAAAPLRLSMEQQSKSAFGLKTQEAVQLGRQAGSNQPLISLLVRAERSPPTIPPHSPPSTIYSISSGGSLRRLRGHQSERGESARTRHGRQTLSSRRGMEPIIGQRFVINCVERGEPENENTDFLNLCTTCWTWRQLPEDYFPRLLNELVCQEHDFCLSGWGVCNQRYRNFDVLQRVTVGGQEEWRPTTISAASCCDCKVKAGSQAHSLVVGGRS